MIDRTEPHIEMTGARRNELLRAAKTKAEKRAINLAYEERQCRLRLAQANALLEKMNSESDIPSVEGCSIEGLKCKLISYRKGTKHAHIRVRTGMDILGHSRQSIPK